MLGGAAALVIGAFPAWAEFSFASETISKSGIDGDGSITLVFGLAVGILGVVALVKRTAAVGASIAVLVLGILALAISVIDMADVSSNDFDIGIGLYLTALGSLVTLGAGILGLIMGRKSSQPGGPVIT